jgi:hypothetical protein
MYASTFHWLPILTGHTGRYPPSYAFLRRYLPALPAPEAFALVARCTGLRWILAHDESPARLAAWASVPAVRARETFPGERAGGVDRLYEVMNTPPPNCRLFGHGITAEGNAVVTLPGVEGDLGVVGLPAAVDVGGETPVSIRLGNRGSALWPGTAIDLAQRFTLWVYWDGAGRPARGVELPLPIDVPPGETRTFSAWLQHPATAGSYRLRVTGGQGDGAPADLVWEQPVVASSPAALLR